jgi:hypothetical protein
MVLKSYSRTLKPVKVEGRHPINEMPDDIAKRCECVQGHRLQRVFGTADVPTSTDAPKVAVDEREWPEYQVMRRALGLQVDVPAAYLLHAENELQESEDGNTL